MKKIANAQATDGGLDKPESTLIEVLSQQLRKLHEIGHGLDECEIGAGTNSELAFRSSRIASRWSLIRHANEETVEEIEDFITETPVQGNSDIAIKLMLVCGILDTLRDTCFDNPDAQLERAQKLTTSALAAVVEKSEIDLARFAGSHYVPRYSEFLAGNRVRELAKQVRQEWTEPSGQGHEVAEP